MRAVLGALLVLVAIPAAPMAAAAQGGETVGIITESKPGRGRVEVKAAAGGDWRPATPLLALRAGDSVRASDDALAVVMLAGGRGVVRVQAANSPVVLAAPGGADGKADKVRALVESSLGFLSRTTKEAPRGILATRGALPPPIVLTPRGSLVRPEGLAFEWVGSARARYAVRLSGPAGPVFERAGVPGTRLPYPDDAPALQAGGRYTVEVRAAGQAAQRAEFEVLDAEAVRAIARDLGDLDAALGAGAPASSAAVMRAAYLADRRLYHEARDMLLRALRADPEEASLFVLLGNVYERTGLPAQAGEAFEEAQWLATRGAEPAARR
jgi:hypothetical protein